MATVERPPRRAERMREQLRAEILDTAFDVFAERGYHESAIADIAQRLGIGHGTVYRHFDNKRDLLEHVMSQVLERVLGVLEAENAPGTATTLEGYRLQTRRIAKGLFELSDSDPRILRMLLFEATSIDQELTDQVLALLDRFAAITAAYLENGVRRGYLRAGLDVERTARALNGVILSALLQEFRTPATPDERERTIEAGMALMFSGVQATPEGGS